MSGRKNRPPKDEPWIWLTRELLSSDAWRGLSINARRFLDFLMIESMNKGGQENGRLKATHRQLQAFGIGPRYVAGAIREAEAVGLVDCHRGGMRVATTYTLTWLERHDGTPATSRWLAYRDPAPKPRRQKIRNLPAKQQADGLDLPAK